MGKYFIGKEEERIGGMGKKSPKANASGPGGNG